MARVTTHYSQHSHGVTINGVTLVDFADGESIRANYGGDQSSVTKGFDSAVQSLAYDPTGSIEVDLKSTSPSNDFLRGLLATQKPGIFLDISGSIVDGTGAVHSGTGGAIKTPANVSSGGPAQGKRTWIIEFTDFITDK